MTLTLDVIASGGSDDDLGHASIGHEGGTIGRHPGSSLVLADAKVSSQHAIVSYDAGVFYIEDTSRNGTSVNSAANRLAPRQPYPIEAGDILLIGPYRVRVSVSQGAGASRARVAEDPARRDDRRPFSPFADEDPFDQSPPVRPPELEHLGQEASRAELDPLRNLFGDEDAKPAGNRKGNVPRAQDLDRGLPFDAHYQAPAVEGPPAPDLVASAPLIPAGYNPLEEEAPSPVRIPDPLPPTPPPPPVDRELPPVRPRPGRPAPVVRSPIPVSEPLPPPVEPDPAPPRESGPPVRPDGGVDLGTVLAGAGLDPSLATPELGAQLGEILRVVVSGVMDVMESRGAIKDELDLRRTRFRAAENNPLKFSANVDDALHNLLVKRNPAYLPPVAAFERAFDDLRHHQVAMLAGVQAGFESLLAAFDPERLQQEFEKQAGGGLMPAKLRYWDLYRERVQELLKDRETTYRTLFAAAFARAYAERLELLKGSGGGASAEKP